MRTEKSCGAVIFTRKRGQIRFCVIRQTNGDYGFPKGHMEQGETEQETALREVFEEVGLRVTLIDGFREELCYPLTHRPGSRKNVVYFLGEFSEQTPVCQPKEVLYAGLVSCEKAMDMLTFPDLQQILRKANAFLCAKR